MSDPLALLPYALAAGGGVLDGVPAAQWVAAGLAARTASPALARLSREGRAGILLPPSGAFLSALAASDGAGCVLLNPLASTPELAFQVTDGDVRVVYTQAALADRLPPALPRVLLDDAPRSARVLTATQAADVTLSAGALALAGDPEADGRDEEALVVYTSAMEGRPLGAILTHRNLLANARAAVIAGALEPADHSLAVLPFAQLLGLVMAGMAPLLAGGRVSTMPRFHPLRVAERIVADRVTVLVGVPAMFHALLELLDRRGNRLEGHVLRLCIAGGAAVPAALQERWLEQTGVELRQGYGLTEAAPVCLFNRVGLPNHRGTLGVPFPGVDVAIRDPETGVALPPRVEGEICVRGPNVSPGYVGGGARGLRRWGEWLCTGDRGVQNGDGTVTFRGLLKPMFTRSGFNIYPRELERAVARMPGVARARVWAIPDARREHEIGIEVWGAVRAEDVRRWCVRELAEYKQPREVIVRPAAG
jgi:long-chain acyl-CoA synthetase